MPNTPIQAAGEAMLSAETPHEKIRRLSWRIADLLNGLDPRIDYVTICASGSGAHAVMTGFNIPFGGEDDIETLFHRWKEAEAAVDAAESGEDIDRELVRYHDIQKQIANRTPATARELAIMLLTESDRWQANIIDRLKPIVASLTGEAEGV